LKFDLLVRAVGLLDASDDTHLLELEHGSVKALLYSVFIRQEAVEDPCMCEIFVGDVAKSKIGGGCGWVGLGWVVALGKRRVQSSHSAGDIIYDHGVYSLVLEAGGAF
jgi:hypothetical protein